MIIISKEFGQRALSWLDRIYSRVSTVLVKEKVPPYLKLHILIMRATGIWPTTDDSRWYKWLTVACFSFIGMLLPLSMLVNVLFVDSINEAMNTSFASLACLMCTFKAGVIYWRCNSIRAVFSIDQDRLRPAECSAEKCIRIAHITRMNIRTAVIFTSVYLLSAVGVFVQVIVSKPVDGILSSTAHWPYEWAQRRTVYSIVLASQMLCSVGIIIWAGINDAFFIALMHTFCGHLAELKEHLQSLGSEYAEEDGNRDLHFHKDLIDCCKHYGHCMRYAKMMNKVLSPVFFVQFGGSVLNLCCPVYLMSVSNPQDDLFKYITLMTFFLGTVAHILVNCYFGSRLSVESDGITNAIYESQWMDRNEKCKRAICILVERSMRPLTIYAGGLFELSLPTFVKICRAAYSYFNVLRRMDSKVTV